MTTCWGILRTELFEVMRLRRIAFVRRGFGSCEERSLLGCSEADAFEGGRGVVKPLIGQLIAPGVPHDNGLSTAARTPAMQSRKHTCVR